MKIAIIGGGLSAYFLAYQLRGRSDCTVEIFELRGNAGGNCHTCSVDVGASPAPTFARWADLAVNDFNAPMYREVVAVMDELGVEYAPLEDTASFYTSDGEVGYTLDGGWGTPAPADYDHLYSVFAARAWDVMNGSQAQMYSGMSVGQFLGTEAPFAADGGFATNCVLARVNAMYFCADAGPSTMPIQTAYLYYLFQEGFGTDTFSTPNGPVSMINRQYFKRGAASFVAALKESAHRSGVVVHSGGPATVQAQHGSSPVVSQDGVAIGPYDAVVFTTHANDASIALGPSYDQTWLGGLLASVNYTKSTAYVHVDQSLLPAPELRRTYNVWIRNASEKQSYSMTYVINQHQADRFNTNTANQYFECPEYYVSLDPVKAPAAASILIDKNTGAPAQYDFWHNVGDTSLQAAQTRLWASATSTAPAIQGMNGVYFVGGWTVGAGLMIECWTSVRYLVEAMNGGTPHAAFDKTRAPEHYAPSYLRSLRPPKSRVGLGRRR